MEDTKARVMTAAEMKQWAFANLGMLQHLGNDFTQMAIPLSQAMPSTQTAVGQAQLALKLYSMWVGDIVGKVMQATEEGRDAMVDAAVAKGNVIEMPTK